MGDISLGGFTDFILANHDGGGNHEFDCWRRKMWREDLDPKITVVRELAREFDALLIPLDGLFAQASMTAPPSYWAPDGVHPSAAGHALIAKAWLKTVKADVAIF